MTQFPEPAARSVKQRQYTLQDLRKDHLDGTIFELPNKVIVQQPALDPVDRLPTLVG